MNSNNATLTSQVEATNFAEVTTRTIRTPPAHRSYLPSATSRWNVWVISFGIWGVFAFLDAAGSGVYSVVTEGQAPNWKLLLPLNAADAFTWAMLTPVIYKLSRRHNFGVLWKPAARFHVPIGFLFAISAALATASLDLLSPWSHFAFHFSSLVVGLFLGNVPRYFLIVAVTQAIVYYSKFRERELQSSQLEAQLVHAQLQALKMQLEPHFLFNVLNSIAALTGKDPSAAETMTLQLADLLRISLKQ
jgi:two-component system, LytTR family, sensor kinase